MIKGTAEVKKGMKYLGDDKFELTLTNVTTNDIVDLLATNGSKVVYQFNSAMGYHGEVREEPENGKLYNVVNGMVQDVRPADPERATNKEGDDSPIDECPCETCIHLVDWPDDTNPDERKKICEAGQKLEDGTCGEYRSIVDIGAGEDDGEPVNSLTAEEIIVDEGQPFTQQYPEEETEEESTKED